MNDRLSFYRNKDSVIHALNPFTKLTLVFALVVCGLGSAGFWTASILVCLALIPLVLAAKLLKEYLGTALKLILPTAGFMFVMQSIFIPGGTTEIFRVGIFSIELETSTKILSHRLTNFPGDIRFHVSFVDHTPKRGRRPQHLHAHASAVHGGPVPGRRALL